MDNSKSPPHTRTSTSASALIAEPTEDIVRRTGIQLLALLNIITTFARNPAFPQLVEQIAPDAAGLFASNLVDDNTAVKKPVTLAEKVDFVRRALRKPRSADISLRAFAHLMADDLRAAHPGLTWGEIAEILEAAGFDGATADSVRQAVKSAPASKAASDENESPAVPADAQPASPPVDRPSEHDSAASPGATVSPAAADRAGPRLTAMPGSFHGEPGTVDPGQTPRFGHDGPPIGTPRMPWTPRPAAPSSDSTEQRPIERDGVPGRYSQADPDRDGSSDRAATVPPRAAEHRSPDPGQPGGAPARPISQTAYPPHPNVAPGVAAGFDRGDPALRDATTARQPQASADRSAASGVDRHPPPQHDAGPAGARPARPGDPRSVPAASPPIEQPTAAPRPNSAALPNQGTSQTPPAPDDDEYDAFAPETWRPRPRP